jgi:hypothetical protein
MTKPHPLALNPDVQSKIKQAALGKALDYRPAHLSTDHSETRLRCYLNANKRKELLFSVPLGSSKASLNRAYAVFNSLFSLAEVVIQTATEAADTRGKQDHEKTLLLLKGGAK